MNILILGASYDQLAMIHSAQGMWLKTIVCDQDEKAPGMALADVPAIANNTDPDAVSVVAGRYAADGICTMATNLAPRAAAIACQRLGLPSITPDAAFRATSKALMRMTCDGAGITVVKGSTASDKDGARVVCSRVGLPVLFKPSDGAGCMGIQVVRDGREIDRAFNMTKAAGHDGCVVVERYYEDALTFGVESLIHDGKTYVVLIADKLVRRYPVISTAGVTVPTVLSMDRQAVVVDLVTRIHAAMGLTMGATHIDFVWGEDGPLPIDIGPRLPGGSLATHIASRLAGIDMVRFVIEQSLGITSAEPLRPGPIVSGAGVERFFYTLRSGMLRDYHLPTPGKDIFVQWRKPRGSRLILGAPNVERLGIITAIRPTIKEAVTAVEEYARGVSMDVRDATTHAVVSETPAIITEYERS